MSMKPETKAKKMALVKELIRVKYTWLDPDDEQTCNRFLYKNSAEDLERYILDEKQELKLTKLGLKHYYIVDRWHNIPAPGWYDANMTLQVPSHVPYAVRDKIINEYLEKRGETL